MLSLRSVALNSSEQEMGKGRGKSSEKTSIPGKNDRGEDNVNLIMKNWIV